MDELHPINQRFKLVVDKKAGGVKSRFSEMIDFKTGQTIGAYIKGEFFPSGEVLFKILSTFPDISAEWLLRGEGEMLKYKSSELSENLIDLLEAADLDTIKTFVKTLVNEKAVQYEAKKKQMDEDRSGKD